MLMRWIIFTSAECSSGGFVVVVSILEVVKFQFEVTVLYSDVLLTCGVYETYSVFIWLCRYILAEIVLIYPTVLK